jgi:hydroxyacylglutathione hydrolase
MPEIISLPFGYFEACSYLISLPSSTCLIDPAVMPERLPYGIRPVRWIFATHGHFDHISHADILRQATGAPLLIHRQDADHLTHSQLNLSVTMQRSSNLKPAEALLDDQQFLPLTDGFAIEVIHTPGHTSGSICLLLLDQGEPAALFSGDTIFAGSIGRLDLGGSLPDMVETLNKLRELERLLGGRNIPVYPGHGPATTLLDEIRTNPYFHMNPGEINDSDL